MLTENQKADARQFFISHMTALFSPPYHIRNDPILVNLAIDEYTDAIGIYGPSELHTAWENIKRSHKTQGWPVLAVCLEACEQARHGKYGMKKPYVDPYSKPSEPIDPILTDKQLKKLQQDIAACDRLAARGVVKDYFGRILDNSKYTKLGKIGRGILAKHERAVGSAGG